MNLGAKLKERFVAGIRRDAVSLMRLGRSLGKMTGMDFERGYAEVSGIGRQMSDWIFSGINDDLDLYTNWANLAQRSRDLFKLNPYMRKFRKDLIANVFGSEGITLQMKIKEEMDRVVYAETEKQWLAAKQRAYDDWRERAEAIKRARPEFKSPFLRRREFFAEETVGQNGSRRAKATVKAGQPDVYANNLTERGWKEWQKRQNCTVGKRHTYQQTREQRLTMCARDGDVFIRHVRGKQANNRFNYAIQIIASEWIDHRLTEVLKSGNYIKMGVEYNEWDAVVAYYVIRRQAGDWRWSSVQGYSGYSEQRHERVLARDMIHYCEFEDSESGRAAPWITSVIPKLRHFDKYTEAEVISARSDACSGGHYESSIPGTDAADLADNLERVRKDGELLTTTVEPGMWKPLPYGWKANAHNPTHPNANGSNFRKDTLREICAGIGDQYITFSGDLEGTSYSSGRIGSLDVRELWMLTQRFDIDTAEIPIFEAWLEMALSSQAIPLPEKKFEKFNQPNFQGRRWPWVDPLKDAKADQMAIDSLLTSRTRICNENGADFEEIVEEQAIEKILIEEAGLNVTNAAAAPLSPAEEQDDPPATPAKSRLAL